MMNCAIFILALNINGHFVFRRTFTLLYIEVASFLNRATIPFLRPCFIIYQTKFIFLYLLTYQRFFRNNL